MYYAHKTNAFKEYSVKKDNAETGNGSEPHI